MSVLETPRSVQSRAVDSRDYTLDPDPYNPAVLQIRLRPRVALADGRIAKPVIGRLTRRARTRWHGSIQACRHWVGPRRTPEDAADRIYAIYRGQVACPECAREVRA